VVPFLPVFFRDEKKAAEITASLRLEVTEIAFLLGDTENEVKERARTRRNSCSHNTSRRRETDKDTESRDPGRGIRERGTRSEESKDVDGFLLIAPPFNQHAFWVSNNGGF
jgi:hypothetical protein